MKTFKINDEIQIFTFDDGRAFALLSYITDYWDVCFLEQICPSASLKIVRSGTFAYCYDFLANIEEK